jgi:hypothetical protein
MLLDEELRSATRLQRYWLDRDSTLKIKSRATEGGLDGVMETGIPGGISEV